MGDTTYRYCFPGISEASQKFDVINYRDNDSSWHRIAIRDHQFLKTGRSVPECAADIVDLAVAISAADRLSVGKDDEPKMIEIVLPIRNPGLFGEVDTLKSLEDTIYWYTGDFWRFSFSKRNAPRRECEVQECLSLNNHESPVEVALWSGGLDSLAGLYNRLLLSPKKHFTLLGTGSSTIVHRGQMETMLSVDRRADFTGRVKLVRVPIKIKRTSDRPKNSDLRARGFVFLLLGAVCSYLEGQSELNVYENGIGAINLPFRASEVGWDHSRSVHPISILKMSVLVSELLEMPFSFVNPFLFSTKSQMCEPLVSRGEFEMIRQSISCDRLRREKPMQCGLCSSCLLRRQSLAVFGLEDRSSYVATSRCSTEKNERIHEATHLPAMVCQVETLRSLLLSENSWDSLSNKYGILVDIVDRTAQSQGLAPVAMQGKLLDLYSRYVREWDVARPIIEQGQSLP